MINMEPSDAGLISVIFPQRMMNKSNRMAVMEMEQVTHSTLTIISEILYGHSIPGNDNYD